MLNAEELGVTSKNVDDKVKSELPDARRLLGAEGNFGDPVSYTHLDVYKRQKYVNCASCVYSINPSPRSGGRSPRTDRL